ncbi:hypothetical protein VKT23_011820 [Stygiomarasmius scandens]|uniref:Uncharacterized protein n=1 Tax=Marasmiellus scandens TaxID=2682957 RepID=A0ABR1JDN4_9AGAR
MSFHSQILTEIPPILDSSERESLSVDDSDPKSSTILYEALLEKYDQHPYFLVRLAKLRTRLRSDTVALSLYEQVGVSFAIPDSIHLQTDART